MYSIRFSYFCFFLFGYLCTAQQETLVEIIDSGDKREIIQQKIDSFFSTNEKKMSQKQLADCYHDVGNKWYNEQWWISQKENDIENAIFYTEKALELKLKIKDVEEGSLPKTYYNLGIFYYNKGDIYSAIDSYSSVTREGNDPILLQDARLELGYLYLTTGDFYKALEQFTDIINFYKNSEIGNYINLIDALILRAETYSLINMKKFSDEIHSNLMQADSIFSISNEKNEQFRRRIDHLEGNRLLETGNYGSAIAQFEKALNGSSDLRPDDIAHIYNSIGYSQLNLKNFDEAFKQLQKSTSLNSDYSLPYENLGDLFLEQHDFEKAMFNYHKAIVWATDKEGKIDSEELPKIQDLELATEKIFVLGHIIAKANGWLKYYEFDNNKGHLTYALNTFALADQLVDIIRFESTEQQSKLFWREKGASLYMQAVKVCHLLNKPEMAFYFMERNKALLLLEDVSSEQAKEIAQLPEAMAKREFELKRSIFLSENELQTGTDPSQAQVIDLKKEIYENKQAYGQFVDSLETAFPDYVKFKKNVAILPYADFVKKYVTQEEAVMQYIMNDTDGYGLLTSEDGPILFRLEKVPELHKKLGGLHPYLSDFVSNRDKMKTYATLSNQIFQELVPPKVYDKVKGKKLTIVADDNLQQIPFEAFVVTTDRTSYFIENTEIRYAYSMSYLSAKESIENNPEKGFIGMAPIQFETLGLPELAFSGIEVNEVENIYKGSVLLRDEATKHKLEQNLFNHSIIHLSTHADVTESGNHWIAFNDEKLYLNEIYANKNQADMVVLSGCNTSLGELKKGEGAMSLARGFFSSGSKSVVSSLWTIYDKSSKDIMVDFYEGLHEGKTKSAALRKAKLNYLEKYRDANVPPSHWAALIVIGDNAELKTNGFFIKNRVWILSGVLALLLIYFGLKKTHRQSLRKSHS